MQDSISSGKAIKVTPDELIFDQVQTNQVYVQELTFKNTLSAQVEINLKSSNLEKLDIEPKQRKLAPFESFTAEAIVKVTRQFPQKSLKLKESIFIRSDFFDQKINVTIIPSAHQNTQTTTPRDNSLQSSLKLGNNKLRQSKRDTARDSLSMRKKDHSPNKINQINDLEKELERKSNEIVNLQTSLKQKEMDLQNLQEALKEETQNRKQIEESKNLSEQQNSNQENLNNIRILLREREPNLEKLMDLTLRKEKEQQERKDAKILEILKIKDAQIAELQQKLVNQETEFGKLAQQCQELKRRERLYEEELNNYRDHIKQLMNDIETLQGNVQEYQSKSEFQTIHNLENQLQEQNEMIEQLQQKLNTQEFQLTEKQQNEDYYQEALERLKDQLEVRDLKISEQDKIYQEEKEKRIREEEHVKSLMQQIDMINRESIDGKTLAMQHLQSGKEYFDKITKLQDDKNEMISTIESMRREETKVQEFIRNIIEKICQIRGQSQVIVQAKDDKNKNIYNRLENKVEDIGRLVKELNDECADLNKKSNQYESKINQQESEIQLIIEENEKLKQQLQTKKKQKSIQTHIDLNELSEVFDKQNMYEELENQNQHLKKELDAYKEYLQSSQKDLEKANEQLNFIMKNSHSVLQNSSQSQYSQNPSQDQVIYTLNSQLLNMKQNEEKLQKQVNQLQSVYQFDNFNANSKLKESNFRQYQSQLKQQTIEERLREYEQILYEQKDRLIQLQRENHDMKQQLKESSQQKSNEIQVLEQRINNLSQLNQKYEQVFAKEQMSGFSDGRMSTAVESETYRQQSQQLELSNMNLKHQIEEITNEKSLLQDQYNDMRKQFESNVKQLISLQENANLAKYGLDCESGDKEKQMLRQTINEYKEKLKKYEIQNDKGKNTENDRWTTYRIEDLIKTNEKLRKEHLQQIQENQLMKEEHLDLLNEISETYNSHKQKLVQENMTLSRKVEQQQNQILYMEKKELRLYQQLQEAKQSLDIDSNEKQQRLLSLEDLLLKKDEIISDLEREIKSKEKSLQERQEQISVLIGTLEKDMTEDEVRQKLLNLAAELCQVKAIQAQQERKANELVHQCSKYQMQNSKLQKQSESDKIRIKDLNKQISQFQETSQEQENKIHELEMQKEEGLRQLSDLKYKQERLEFQLQLKEESVQQLRNQLKTNENLFKDEVNRIRKELLNKSATQGQNTNFINNSLPFKNVLQKLTLVINSYLQQAKDKSEKILIQEFEKALQIASSTIESIQEELDNERLINYKQQNEFAALSQNKILISRMQSITKQLSQIKTRYEQRDDERSNYIIEQEQRYQQLIRQFENKFQQIEKDFDASQDKLIELKRENSLLQSQNEELESNILCFQQEMENQKLSMERKAELTIDERYKTKQEQIKTYFDSNITRILLNQSSYKDKELEFGREICSLQLLIKNMEQKLMVEQSEKESLEINMNHFKEIIQANESQIKSLREKLTHLNMTIQSQENQIKLNVNRKKQEIFTLEKQVIQLKQENENKSRQIAQLQENAQNGVLIQQKQFEDNQILEDIQIKQKLETANNQILELQDKLLQIRDQHMLELEEIKVQYDIEMEEAKRYLQEEKLNYEKMYKPGFSPGELLNENDNLQERITQMKVVFEQVTQENIIIRKKLEQERVKLDQVIYEKDAQRQALFEVESTLIEGSTNLNQQSTNNKILESNKKSLKISKAKINKSQLHFKKQEQEDQECISKIQSDDSLNVSALTSMRYNSQNVIRNQQELSFIINPPQLVKELINSKVKELLIRKRAEDLQRTELELRNKIKEVQENQRNNYKYNSNNEETEFQEIKKRLIELEIENEELNIKIAQQNTNHYEEQKESYKINEKQQIREVPMQDYSVLVNSVIALSTFIAQIEQNQNKNDDIAHQQRMIEESQRIVIKCLSQKLMGNNRQNDIQYQPSNEQDKKIWYLELLEQQVNQADQSINNLQSFIKKLQVEIQGNLQSAAQIKAASMDLASNTMKTSEEIQMLRQVSGLIRHDLNQMLQSNPQKTIGNKTINPFSQKFDAQLNQSSQNQIYEKLVQSNEELQNSIVITEKVNQSLENEIIQLKLTQAQELQTLSKQLQQTVDQRNSLLSTNEELHDKVSNLEKHLDNLKTQMKTISHKNEENLTALTVTEKEKETIAKTKNATSKHLQKLQQDMSDWRKQTEENIQIKDKQINEFSAQVKQLQTEKDRLKAENSMLRRNQKDKKSGESEEVQKLKIENDELREKLEKEIEDRKQELEYWITERATMREMIDQLENEKVGIFKQEETDINKDDKVKKIKQKGQKKLKQKEAEIKQKHKENQDLANDLSKLKLNNVQLEHKIRDLNQQVQELEQKSKYQHQKIKEVELERDLVLAEKQNTIATNDLSAQQIQEELNSLRECFAKLKIERDNLLYDIDLTQQREREWRTSVEDMNQEIRILEEKVKEKEVDQEQKIKVIEAKNNALVQDIKFLKSENQKLKDRIQENEGSINDYEQQIQNEQSKANDLLNKHQDIIRLTEDYKYQIQCKDNEVQSLQEKLVINEVKWNQEIQNLKEKIDQIKEANAQIISLYENQLEDIKNKIIKESKKTESQADQIFTLSQREAVIKQLKKENTQFKQQITKIKAKNKELKTQVSNQENVNNAQMSNQRTVNKNKNKIVQKPIETHLDKGILKLAEMLQNEEGFSGIYEKMQQLNQINLKVVEKEAALQKNENWCQVLSQQLQEQQKINEILTLQIESNKQTVLKESKVQKKSQIDIEQTKQLKQEIKNLQQELKQVKSDWISPQDYKSQQDQIKELQNQIKQLKEDISRKKEVINQMKQQREQTEVEANQILQDMEGLKDDNVKLQKLIRENNKNQGAVKELKSSNDYLKLQEKKLKEEIHQLNDKLKSIKIDQQRKENIIKELKDKLESYQNEVSFTKDKSQEIEKQREKVKKYQLESEIKENQVKALKQRLESAESEIQELKQKQSQLSMTSNTQSQADKNNKQKFKKYEGYLKKSLEALKRIGKELAQQNTKISKNRKSLQSNDDDPLQITDLEKEMYKDSVNILGVSMDELQEFMNPSAIGHQSVGQSKEEQSFHSRLEKVLGIPESLNQEIDEICSYCLKLINEIN